MRDGLELNVSNIRDYMPDGTETWYPDMRKGQCPSGKKCSDCIKQNIPDLPVIIPGDLYVVGEIIITYYAFDIFQKVVVCWYFTQKK